MCRGWVGKAAWRRRGWEGAIGNWPSREGEEDVLGRPYSICECSGYEHARGVCRDCSKFSLIERNELGGEFLGDARMVTFSGGWSCRAEVEGGSEAWRVYGEGMKFLPSV